MRRNIVMCVFVGVMAVGTAAAEVKFEAVEIDNKIEIGYGIAVADVDGDRRQDVVLADKQQIVWYQNPSWKKHVIAEKLTKLDHVCIAAADIDGDGKAELAAGGEWNPGDTLNSGAVFYLNPPKDRTQKWEPIRLHHEPTVHRMRWVKNEMGGYDLVVVPLHGRGNRAGSGVGVKILAYKRPSDPTQTWKTEVLDESLHMAHNFDPMQWGRDIGEEMLIAAKEGVHSLNRVSGKWKLMQLSGTESGGAGEVRAGKLAGGNTFFATVEPMHGTNLVLYIAPHVNAPSGLWSRKVLDSTLVDGHALACGDLAGIGSDQIVVGWRAINKPGVKVGIKMFTPLDKSGAHWKEQLVDDNTMACEDLCLADLNGDKKLDIVAAGRATKNVKIYFTK